MSLKVLLPELNSNQIGMLYRLMEEVIGEKQYVWGLVQQGNRQGAKEAGAINAEKEIQLKRLRVLFGVPEPPKPTKYVRS